MRGNLIENIRALGNILYAGLRNLQSKYNCIGDVRGRRLMAGVIMSNGETKAADVELGKQIAENVFKRDL
ncbi:hypothetical protein NOF04DRAFT_9509 [Fusarium oxysporum II5]|uniref:2,2-dialkylglycine decarboxylase (Pyruvate) n=2 Tax=Fusarium oxysporum species complex TaxID=171631 RepID=X0KH29_FUSO5|nr:2,2-dialkylglycine decarboxylase (pyruvate) [Fusarium odoratissimum NRRL 54006]EXL96219.1 2,2-dialkylglycine decarboxylase (pyruvate) [Fusarium odoratissimum NRRL 54006]KAK2125421.1 hypothetical protein NOF04DRAFT_9509 [Fusarium oxysporum II5]TXB99549.1 hypothetical protein FocTR4_00013588 [Fusarium oxysporum f. sp. cubense]